MEFAFSQHVFVVRALPKRFYDVWMPSLGPSERLLLRRPNPSVDLGKIQSGVSHELFIAGSLDKANRTIKNHDQKFTLRLLESLAKPGNVPLMCHCAENASTLPSLAF
jgi:hypothetical protein